MKIGDKLKNECISCGEEEIWEIESISKNLEYLDGLFNAYNLKSIKCCFPAEIRTTLKDSPTSLYGWSIVAPSPI